MYSLAYSQGSFGPQGKVQGLKCPPPATATGGTATHPATAHLFLLATLSAPMPLGCPRASYSIYLFLHLAMLCASPGDPASVHPSALPVPLTASSQAQNDCPDPSVLPSSLSVWSESHFYLPKGCGRSREQTPDRFHVHVLGASGTLHLRLRAHLRLAVQVTKGSLVHSSDMQGHNIVGTICTP